MAEPSEILGRFVRALLQFENAARQLSFVTRQCEADRTQISGKKRLSRAKRQVAIDQINERFQKAFDEMCDAGMAVQELFPEAREVIDLPAGVTRNEYCKQFLTLVDCLVNESDIDVRDVGGGGETGSHVRSEEEATTPRARGTGSKRGTAIRGRNARSQGSMRPSAGHANVVRSIPATNSLERLRQIREDLTLQLRLIGSKGAANPKAGEGIDGSGSTPEHKAAAPGDARQAVLQQLEPAVRKAYLAFQYAETLNSRRMEDREAYDWLHENGIDQGKGDLGELTDYELPNSFETFRRYVTAARLPLGESKYTRRGGRPRGRSVVRGDEIEYQKGDEE